MKMALLCAFLKKTTTTYSQSNHEKYIRKIPNEGHPAKYLASTPPQSYQSHENMDSSRNC